MKGIKTLYIVILSVCFLGAISCNTPTQISSDYAYLGFTTECLGVELDGSQTLRVFGIGKDKADAIEQAKKNAVRDVIFRGINAGSGECFQRPLINEVNAQEKYSYYFNPFFKDKGDYSAFVRLDEKRQSRIKAANNTQENWGVVVTVDRAGLQQKLINDGIIKQ